MNETELFASLAINEGYRGSPYLDTKGLWTGGIGQCFETNPLTGPQWKYLLDNKLLVLELSYEGAKYLASQKVADVRRALKAGIPTWEAISDPRQNVLIEMAFQLSHYGALGFPDMLAAVVKGDWEAAAAAGLDSKWAKIDSPARAQKLMKALREDKFP